MFAVLKTGGKQYKVQKDDKIEIEKLDVEAGQTVTLDEVLLVGDDKKSTIGAPFVKGATVVAEIVSHIRGPKITVFKKKRRQNYRRKKGHRQDLTLIKITDIKSA
jgi:large subunit ribosomal protein L21